MMSLFFTFLKEEDKWCEERSAERYSCRKTSKSRRSDREYEMEETIDDPSGFSGFTEKYTLRIFIYFLHKIQRSSEQAEYGAISRRSHFYLKKKEI
jgi:hypothetical protein